MIRKSFSFFHDKDFDFSVNLCREDLFNQDTVSLIYKEIDLFPDPRKITFELLETEKIDKSEEVLSFISKVKENGCKIAIDDFGSGYSNFNYILALSIDIIKIDASLIKDIHQDPNSMTITKNIVNFAKEMNIKTIAEYVHNSEVFSVVEYLGIDYVQGYFIGKPSPDITKSSVITLDERFLLQTIT
ncbi:MAG: EAL domain-containing protein [Spirochaetales bacterium]|nr:EAL domain-containing protein [Spirochaetales bacterium]